MRKDMDKLLCERERVNSSAGYRQGRCREKRLQLIYDEEGIESNAPNKRPMKTKRPGFRRKALNENLAPLRGFLNKNVGRPWNKVYSEIREHFKPNSAVRLHIYQHLMQYVETRPMFMADGTIFASDGRFRLES